MGRVVPQVNLLEQSQRVGESSPLAEQEKKRPRREELGEKELQQNQTARVTLTFEESGGVQDTDTKMASSASSLEEGRRAQ